jgi:sodium-coupled monocarboxylate transporter 8/12
MIRFAFSEWVIVAIYVITVTAVGSFCYRKNSSAAEFFLGGRSMGAIPVAISLVAADMSAISYMGLPAWSFRHNMELYWVSAGYILAVPVVMYLFLPFYMKLNLYTGYEYLERRFNRSTRMVASGLFLIMRGSHVAIAIYAPSIVLSLLTGLPLLFSVLLMGIVTTLYTSLGGMKAVIWTDVLQFGILMAGVCAVFWLAISHIPGGPRAAYHIASAGGRLHMLNFSFDPRQLSAFWPGMFGGAVMILSTLGTDQAYLQRYFATRSLKEGRRAVLVDALIILPVAAILYLLGAILYAFYHTHPQRLAGLPNDDALVPFFVMRELGGVFSGLVIASIFASSMAVMSAGINALTTATTVDFYQRWFRTGRSDSHYVSVGRWGTVGWGAACTLCALFVSRLGPLANAFNKMNAFIGGPILGIFLLGMLTRRAKGTAAITGAGIAFLVVSWLNWKTDISFFYHALIGMAITFAVGYLLSLYGTRPQPKSLEGLVYGHPSLTPELDSDKR